MLSLPVLSILTIFALTQVADALAQSVNTDSRPTVVSSENYSGDYSVKGKTTINGDWKLNYKCGPYQGPGRVENPNAWSVSAEMKVGDEHSVEIIRSGALPRPYIERIVGIVDASQVVRLQGGGEYKDNSRSKWVTSGVGQFTIGKEGESFKGTSTLANTAGEKVRDCILVGERRRISSVPDSHTKSMASTSRYVATPTLPPQRDVAEKTQSKEVELSSKVVTAEISEQCSDGICLNEEITKYSAVKWKIVNDDAVDYSNAHPIAKKDFSDGLLRCINLMKSQLSAADAQSYCRLTDSGNASVKLMELLAKNPIIICRQQTVSNEFNVPNGLVRVFFATAKDGKLRVSKIHKFFFLSEMDSANEVKLKLKQKHPYFKAFDDESKAPWGGTVGVFTYGKKIEYSIVSASKNFGRPTLNECQSRDVTSVK